MRNLIGQGVLMLAVLSVAWPARASDAESARREQRKEPGLVLNTGGRTAACDVLRFTPDGKSLLATGDDKVVRVWRFDGTSLDPEPPLRWNSWREEHGAIYALALSPDPEASQVVIGGCGLRSGSLAVLDRKTGAVKHELTDFKNASINNTTWSLAFSPSGNEVACGRDDGSVWLWNLHGGPNDFRLLGRQTSKSGINYVRLVAFVGSREVISVSRDGRVCRWDTAETNVPPRQVFHFNVPEVFRAAISPDGRWLAVAGGSSRVEVASLNGGEVKRIPLAPKHFPHCLAFDRQGKRLAVGVRVVGLDASGFYDEQGAEVDVFDLTAASPRSDITLHPTYAYRPEALAFDPEGKYLAVADGIDYEVTVWDVSRHPAPAVALARGQGTCLWGVGLSADGRYLGIQDRRAKSGRRVNARGDGEFRVFDLQKRAWARAEEARALVKPIRSAGGWTVEQDPQDAFQWNVVRGGERYPLLLDRERYALPRCYTFLEARDGKPVRLAVGHYWGLSVFELRPGSEPVQSRIFVGHEGEVMAVAPSADQKLLVSASRDQTVEAWSLADWPRQRELGANFDVRLGKVLVLGVETGSPAWEAGLSAGDEVVVLASDVTAFLYDPEDHIPAAKRKQMQHVGTAEECLRRLEHPAPGKELYFQYRRPGEAGLRRTVTKVRQRPVWRFLPARDGEWVLWRPLDYYYDASTLGDTLIGWQVNGDDHRGPQFYEATQFKEKFYNPDKVAQVVQGLRAQPDRTSIVDIEPPRVELEAATRSVTDADLPVTLAVTPRGGRALYRPDHIILWVNDYQFREWSGTDLEAAAADGARGAEPFRRQITIPRDALRRGDNTVALQCYNTAGGYETTRVVVRKGGAESRSSLYLLLVGATDYSKVNKRLPKPYHFDDLPGVDFDMELTQDTWERQKGKRYEQVKVVTLKEERVTPAAILKAIRNVAAQARPDDLLLLSLSGHGLSGEIAEEIHFKPQTFQFICPTFDPGRPAETSLTSKALYEALVKVRCRKLVFLNACHTGDVTHNPVRDLTVDGMGPIILAACRQQEESVTDADRGSLFVQAINEALDKKFREADRDGDGKLGPAELARYVSWRVPRMLDEVKQSELQRLADERGAKADKARAKIRGLKQTPDCFPALEKMDGFPLAVK
jgi:WD40 repeat protein